MKWHDGKEFTAGDVKFTCEKILDPEVASPLKPYFEFVERIDVVDDHTLRIQLSKPYAPFLERLVVGIIPRHLLEGKDIKIAEFNQHPVGTGPFKFGEWKKGERLVMEANPDYFLGKPEIDRVVVYFIPDENTRLLQLTKGEVDVALLPPKLAAKAQSQNIQVVTVPTGEWCGIGLPYENPLFRDRNLRQALAYAIDKQAIIDKILEDKGEPTSIPFRGNHWAYNPQAKSYSLNLEKAKALLAASGWKDTDGEGTRIWWIMPLVKDGVFTQDRPGYGKTTALHKYVEEINPAHLKPCYFALSTVTVLEFYQGLWPWANSPNIRR